MTSEKDKMLAGELYDPRDAELCAARRQARLLCQSLNATRDNEVRKRAQLLRQLIPNSGPKAWLEPPFYCDYGVNITLGENVFFNFNCVLLDVAAIILGNNVLVGPGVQMYTATHPLNAEQRRTGLESAQPIVIGDDVWIGGGATLCPGVSIGARSVIGAGSVVTRDIPADCLAVGNPCRVVRTLAEGEA